MVKNSQQTPAVSHLPVAVERMVSHAPEPSADDSGRRQGETARRRKGQSRGEIDPVIKVTRSDEFAAPNYLQVIDFVRSVSDSWVGAIGVALGGGSRPARV